MKTALIFLQIFFLSFTVGFSQVQLEGKHNAALKIFQSDDGSLKFYKVDQEKKELIIFNEDNSLWKKIDLKIPENHLIDDVKIISASTEKENAEMKILFTCYYIGTYTMEDVSEHFSKLVFMLNIIDEEGNFLLQVPETSDYKLLTANGKNKLLVYKNDRKGFKNNRQVDVYGF
jgi:hypothetical protein